MISYLRLSERLTYLQKHGELHMGPCSARPPPGAVTALGRLFSRRVGSDDTETRPVLRSFCDVTRAETWRMFVDAPAGAEVPAQGANVSPRGLVSSTRAQASSSP